MNRENHTSVILRVLKSVILFISSGLFIGFIPVGPGTAGSILGIVMWVLLSNSKFFLLYIFITITLAIVFSWYAERFIFRKKDPQQVVIDEIAGILITFSLFKFSDDIKGLIIVILGFIFFRIFDILKPPPIKISQRLRGGFGIVVDDLIAGAYSCLLLFLIMKLINY